MRRNAFTLIELLVVVSIIALLIAVLMPSLSRARDVSKSVACASNLRQLNMGNMVYASDYFNELPAPREWVDNSIAWFDSWKTPQAVKQGTLFKYVGKNAALYLCPKFLDVCPKDVTPAFSYSMNIYFIRPGQVSAQGWDGYPSLRRITDARNPAGLLLMTEENPWLDSNRLSPLDDGLLAPTWDPKVPMTPLVNAIGTYHLGTTLDDGKGNVAFVDGHVAIHAVDETYELGTPVQYR